MAEISFGGLATGLPTEDIVEGLMAAERAPLDRLEKEEAYQTLKLEAYGEFNDKLKTLREAVGDLNLTSEVRLTETRLSSEEKITASSDGAQVGSYDIAVAQLAQMQKDVSSAFSSQSEAVLGTGSFTIGDEVISVDSSNNSLQGLMEAINAVSDDTGVSATIINDGGESDNYHLVFTGEDASTSFTIASNLIDTSGNAVDFSASRVRDAQQAIAYVDGIEVVSNSNTLSNVISGVTINLNEVSEVITPAADGNPATYATTTLNVEPDTESLKEKITTFVTAYNGVMEWIQSAYDEDSYNTESSSASESSDSDDESTDSSDKTLAYLLRGDSSINGVKRNLQNTLASVMDTGGSLRILSEIGISTQVDGSLDMNSSKIDKALEENFNDIVNLFAGNSASDGVMKKINSYLVETTSSADGLYANKEDSYDSKIERLDTQMGLKESMLEKIEARIRAQFTAMELLVSELNSIGDYLTQNLNFSSNS
ncbi:MAG: flagellar hook-associated protein 2 [Desulforhopalus sp.]|jgi:flagellar hook-associated protein 2